MAPLALAQTSHGRASGAAPPDATATHRGDDALTCEQIKAQLNTIAGDPAFQKMMAQQQRLASLGGDQIAQHPEAANGRHVAVA